MTRQNLQVSHSSSAKGHVRGCVRNSCQIHIFRDIHQVDPAQWDALLGPNDQQLSHRFIRVCQDANIEDAEYWHLVVTDAHGVAAICTLSRLVVPFDACPVGMTRVLIDTIRKAYHDFLRIPILFCGLPVSFGQSCLRFRPDAHVPDLLQVIAETVESVAHQTRTTLVCYKEFDPPEVEELLPLAGRGYLRVPSLPACSLTLRWSSFDDYLAELRCGYRRQITSSLRIARHNSLAVRTLDDMRGHTEPVYELYEQVIDRATHRLERLNRAFFENLADYLQGEYRLILIEQGARPLGMAIVLLSPTVATFLLAGLDFRWNREYQVYQNLVIEVIRVAIAAGAGRLEMGQTSYALKSRMGAEAEPRYLYVRHRKAWAHALLRRVTGVLYPEIVYPCRRVFRR